MAKIICIKTRQELTDNQPMSLARATELLKEIDRALTAHTMVISADHVRKALNLIANSGNKRRMTVKKNSVKLVK